MLSTASALPATGAEPVRRVSFLWILLFSLAWLGLWMSQLTAFQLLLPAQVDAAVITGPWQAILIQFGSVSAVSGVVAAFAYPLIGALSDRTRSRLGRRRTWILVGGLTNAVSMVLLGTQESLAGICVFWTLSVVGFCAASCGLTSLICDQVPINQRGTVSGWIAVPQAMGVVLGVTLAQTFTTSTLGGYALIAAITGLLLIPALLLLHDPPLASTRLARHALSWKDVLAFLWINPVKHPDFAWTLASRTLVNLSNALGTGLLLYFYLFDLKVGDPEALLQESVLLYVAAAVIASVAVGRWSDAIKRRKPFVFIAGLAQASSGVLLALAPSVESALIAACLLGMGTGAYFSVDQALATQVLPNPQDHGKDLAIMNVALIVPQSFGPILGAAIIILVGSFTSLFWLSALVGVMGALAILFVKGSR